MRIGPLTTHNRIVGITKFILTIICNNDYEYYRLQKDLSREE